MDMTHAKDQAFYEPGDIEQHLLCLWDEDYVLKSTPEQEIKSKGDPAIGPTLPAIVADIRTAWARAGLCKQEREIVVCHRFWAMSLEAIAELYKLEPAEVAALYDIAIDKMITFLGGRR